MGRMGFLDWQRAVQLVLLRAPAGNLAAVTASIRHVTGAAAAAILLTSGQIGKVRCLQWRASSMQTTLTPRI